MDNSDGDEKMTFIDVTKVYIDIIIIFAFMMFLLLR